MNGRVIEQVALNGRVIEQVIVKDEEINSLNEVEVLCPHFLGVTDWYWLARSLDPRPMSLLR